MSSARPAGAGRQGRGLRRKTLHDGVKPLRRDPRLLGCWGRGWKGLEAAGCDHATVDFGDLESRVDERFDLDHVAVAPQVIDEGPQVSKLGFRAHDSAE